MRVDEGKLHVVKVTEGKVRDRTASGSGVELYMYFGGLRTTTVEQEDREDHQRRLFNIIQKYEVCMYVWSSHIAEYGSTG